MMAWQEQRRARVLKVIGEYNEKGWVLHDNLRALTQPLESDQAVPERM